MRVVFGEQGGVQLRILIDIQKRDFVERLWWLAKLAFKAWVAVMVFLILRAFGWPR